ncbi:helix-turn-helix domain-containing protein [Streptacidiphilus sp. MAP12-16]|uniref:helix-turn-helix domain-containing protein n=1 Tax=Streptacidiphilus sp. MAP12-16 TaxID=3156300 RepID=UPI0035172022
MITTHAYRFALDPTARQVGALLRHAGAARVALNWGLARVKANLGQREAERSYGVAEAELTPSLSWSMYAMRKAWNQAKGEVAPWWSQCSKEAYATGLDHLARALGNWTNSKKGKRKGPRMGFPRFKSKRKTNPSCRFTTGTIRLEEDRRYVTLPVLGTIKTRESTRKLERRIANGTARVMSATVRREAPPGRAVDVTRPARSPPAGGGGRQPRGPRDPAMRAPAHERAWSTPRNERGSPVGPGVPVPEQGSLFNSLTRAWRAS